MTMSSSSPSMPSPSPKDAVFSTESYLLRDMMEQEMEEERVEKQTDTGLLS